MAYQNNKRILHRKEWQMMTPSPATAGTAAFIVKDPLGTKRLAFLVTSATVHYMYAVDEDAWMQVPSMALAGTFGAGACGCWGTWSNTLTATGGATNYLTLTTSINSSPYGNTVRFLTGNNAGYERICSGFLIQPNGTNVLYFSVPFPNAILNTDTFVVDTGRYYIMCAGTIAAGIFKSYDPLTGVVTTLSNTGLPATWGTDGKICGTPSYVGAFNTGTASAGGATSITDASKTWVADQWINFQVRITAGTGIGQVRTITDNDATSLTVAAWTTPPDNTSVYAIEGNDDYLYLAGNAAVAMYRYSISGNSWTTLAPTAARAAAPSTGMSLNWCGKTGNPAYEANFDGRYIYSFRGGATADLHRFDIAGGTAGAGTWDTINYIGKQETFTTGSSFDMDAGKIFIRKENLGRFFYYDITGNYLYPFSTNLFAESTAQVGDKLFTVSYTGGSGSDTITWVYNLMNNSTVLMRIMVF